MSGIRASLQKLTAAVGNLEGSVAGFESTMMGQQRDMFVEPSNSNAADAGKITQSAQNDVIAERLDIAINKVEKLLAEG